MRVRGLIQVAHPGNKRNKIGGAGDCARGPNDLCFVGCYRNCKLRAGASVLVNRRQPCHTSS